MGNKICGHSKNVIIPITDNPMEDIPEEDIRHSSSHSSHSSNESKFTTKHRMNIDSDTTTTPESSYNDIAGVPRLILAVYDKLNIIVSITTNKLDILYCNGQIESCINKRSDDLVDTNLLKLISPDFHDTVKHFYRNSKKTEFKIRLTIKNNKNKDYWVDAKFMKYDRSGRELITIFMKPIHIEIRLSNLLDNMQKDHDYLRNNVLANVFPSYILPYVLRGEKDFVLEHDNIIVGAFDIVNFSEECAINKTSFNILKPLYYEAQKLCEVHNLYCVEIIGDAMIIAGNCSETRKNTVEDMINFMLDFIKFSNKRTDLDIRCGIAVGRAISGMIGYNQFRYHIFGNAVNIAARMESLSEYNKICITSKVYDKIKPNNYAKYDISSNDIVPVKGLGLMNTYTVNGYKNLDSPRLQNRSIRRSLSVSSKHGTLSNNNPNLFTVTNEQIMQSKSQTRIHSRKLSQCL
jgi:class 3 adenylate cyclase